MLINRLQNNEDLSNSERAVAAFVLANTQKVCNMNTRELAKEAFVSPATVVRFSKKMGFYGFEQFKRQLYAEWTSNYGRDIVIDADFPFEEDTPIEELFDRMLRLEQNAIKATRELINTGKWEGLISDITSCNGIDIYGEGISFDTALNFKTNMNRIGYNVFMENDRGRQVNWCSNVFKDHFNLILSYSGESERTLSIAKFLHENGLNTLSITCEGDNSLKKYTKHHLEIARMEGRIVSGGISNMCSGRSFSFILDLIYASVFQKNYDKNRKMIRDSVLLQSLYFTK